MIFIITIKVQNDFNLSNPKRSFGLSSDATAITPFSRAHFITNFKKKSKRILTFSHHPPAPWLSLDFFPFHRVVYSRPDSRRQGRGAEWEKLLYDTQRNYTRAVAKVAQVATITCLSVWQTPIGCRVMMLADNNLYTVNSPLKSSTKLCVQVLYMHSDDSDILSIHVVSCAVDSSSGSFFLLFLLPFRTRVRCCCIYLYTVRAGVWLVANCIHLISRRRRSTPRPISIFTVQQTRESSRVIIIIWHLPRIQTCRVSARVMKPWTRSNLADTVNSRQPCHASVIWKRQPAVPSSIYSSSFPLSFRLDFYYLFSVV